MKKILILTFLIYVATRTASAQNYREIYDFEVGDIFQYKTWKNTEDWNIYEKVEKYQIVSKVVNGDTIKYSILGKKLDHYYVHDYNENKDFNHRYYVSDINSNLVFIDSINNYLNKPIGSLVMLMPPFSYDTVLTRILVDSSDGIKKKVIGGDVRMWNQSNLFKFTEDTTNLDTIKDDFTIFTTRYRLSYSKNIGFVEEDYWGFEYGYNIILQGFIKGIDTTGIISPDNSFTGLNENLVNNISIFPNPARDYLFFENINSVDFKSIEISDISGKIIIKSPNCERLYIGNLGEGIYIARFIRKDNSYISSKFIKR